MKRLICSAVLLSAALASAMETQVLPQGTFAESIRAGGAGSCRKSGG